MVTALLHFCTINHLGEASHSWTGYYMYSCSLAQGYTCTRNIPWSTYMKPAPIHTYS